MRFAHTDIPGLVHVLREAATQTICESLVFLIRVDA